MEFDTLGEQTDEWIIRMPLDKSSDDSGDISVKTQICSVNLEMGQGEPQRLHLLVYCIYYTGKGVWERQTQRVSGMWARADTASKQIHLFLQASLLRAHSLTPVLPNVSSSVPLRILP